MLVATQLQRVFLFEENGHQLRLADPEPTYSPQSVLNFYSNTYPILTTAKISAPKIENDEVQYVFESVMGTKG